MTVVMALLDRDGGRCMECGVLLEGAHCPHPECICHGGPCPWARMLEEISVFPTINHIVPQVLGGEHDLSNLRLLCQPCNSSKGKRDPWAYLTAGLP
jgi:hypothetical protein